MFDAEAGLALKATTQAGKLLEDVPLTVATRTKESFRDVVTEYDLKIESLVAKLLAPTGFPLLSEETHSTVKPPVGAPFWVLDPIDGTANFVSNLSTFGISLGLCRKDAAGKYEFLVGAVSMPKTREHFFTVGQGGALLNGAKLSVVDAELSQSLVAASFSSMAPESDVFQKTYGSFGFLNHASRGAMRTGSAAVQLCYTAAGRYQVAYGLGVQLWDVAGALAVAAQAGASVRCQALEGTTRVNFVAGAPKACDAVAQHLVKEKLCLL
jgi:myo-inositol-1(or 4)-monophosphatase